MSIAGVDANIGVNTTINKTNVSNNTSVKNFSESEVYNKVENAYNSAVEVVNEVRKTVNQVNDIANKAQTKQQNKVGPVKISGSKGVKLKVEQKNKALQQVSLVATVKAISNLQGDNVTKAIVADMVGLTQKADSGQDAKNSAATTNGVANTTSNERKQELFVNSILSGGKGHVTFEPYRTSYRKEGFNLLKDSVYKECALFGANINVDVNTTINDTNITNNTEQLTSQKTKAENIQKYVTNISEKNKNLQEMVENLTNNLNAASEVDQSNILESLEIEDSEDVDVEFTQANELTQTLTTEFSNFVESASKTTNSNEISTDKTLTTDQGSSQTQTAVTETTTATVVENTTTNKSDQSGGMASMKNIIIMVIVGGIILGIAGLLFKGGFGGGEETGFYAGKFSFGFGKKKSPTSADTSSKIDEKTASVSPAPSASVPSSSSVSVSAPPGAKINTSAPPAM